MFVDTIVYTWCVLDEHRFLVLDLALSAGDRAKLSDRYPFLEFLARSKEMTSALHQDWLTGNIRCLIKAAAFLTSPGSPSAPAGWPVFRRSCRNGLRARRIR